MENELRALAESWRRIARAKLEAAESYPRGSAGRLALEHAGHLAENFARELLGSLRPARPHVSASAEMAVTADPAQIDPRHYGIYHGRVSCVREGDEMVVRFSAARDAPVVLIAVDGLAGWVVRAGATAGIPLAAVGPLSAVFALPEFHRADRIRPTEADR